MEMVFDIIISMAGGTLVVTVLLACVACVIAMFVNLFKYTVRKIKRRWRKGGRK